MKKTSFLPQEAKDVDYEIYEPLFLTVLLPQHLHTQRINEELNHPCNTYTLSTLAC
jgi:hypothetical protein